MIQRHALPPDRQEDRTAGDAVTPFPGHRPVRILLVEDEAITALALSQTLTQLGFLVCGTASSCAGAVMAAEDYHPDLVLMDIRLRGKGDGIDAAAAIRAGLGIPSIFLTAQADPETLGRAQAARPLGFIFKPYTMTQLQVMLGRVVDVLEAR